MKLWKLNAIVIIFCIINSNIVNSKYYNGDLPVTMLDDAKWEEEDDFDSQVAKLDELEGKPRKFSPHVVDIPNPKIQSEDVQHITHKKCQEKTGFLKIVRKPSLLPFELQLYKIFVSVNLNSVNLFLDTSGPRTLFNSIKLNSIIRLAQQEQLVSNNCFDLIVNDVQHKSKLLNKGLVTLCARSSDEMRSWVNAIGEFKQCIHDKSNNLKDDKILVDYNKVNQLLRYKTAKSEGEKRLYYDNTNKVMRKTPGKIKKENEVNKAMGSILDIIRKGSMTQTQLKREMKNKLAEAKKYTEEMVERQEIIKKILKKRQEQEAEKEKSLLKEEGKNKQMQLLKAVRKKIKSMEKDDLSKLQGDLDKNIKEQQKKANDLANNMMRSVLAQNKLRSYDLCISPKLINFEDAPYVQGVCKKYYGEHKEEECRLKQNFCQMCCEHNVGLKFFSRLAKCKTDCGSLISGIDLKTGYKIPKKPPVQLFKIPELQKIEYQKPREDRGRYAIPKRYPARN